MYLIDPAGRTRHRIHPYHQGALLSGYISYQGNRLERVVSRARRELGLEGCCGEPSHGGNDASDGVVFEGHDVGVYAAPVDELPSDDSERMGQLRFDCGGARYFLSDWGPSGDTAEHVPDRELLHRAADRLTPRLYCSRGPMESSDPA
jgi:hypothetical protein